MGSTYQIFLNSEPVKDEFYDHITTLEIEESADAPGSLQLRLPVSRTEDGELSNVSDPGLQPYSTIAVVARPAGGDPGCIFDGVILSHKIHIESGVRASWLEVYAQDASWLMNLEQKAREWANTTDATVANTIFEEYDFARSPDNTVEDSGRYTEDTHTLMQHGTDFEFLRLLARRAGRFFRVRGGESPQHCVGVFAKPRMDGKAVAAFRPNDPEAPNVGRIDIEWDVMRPTSVLARQALLTDNSADGASGDVTESGTAALDERDYPAFAGRPMQVILTCPADDAGQLQRRAHAVLREAEWFVRCSGDADLASLKVLLRPGSVVRVETVGAVHSGKYLVWSVRHTIGAESHRMNFELVRNAVGRSPSGGGVGGLQ